VSGVASQQRVKLGVKLTAQQDLPASVKNVLT